LRSGELSAAENISREKSSLSLFLSLSLSLSLFSIVKLADLRFTNASGSRVVFSKSAYARFRQHESATRKLHLHRAIEFENAFRTRAAERGVPSFFFLRRTHAHVYSILSKERGFKVQEGQSGKGGLVMHIAPGCEPKGRSRDSRQPRSAAFA